MNNVEIIIENVHRKDLDEIVFKHLHIDKQKAVSSHFYDKVNKRDIDFNMLSTLEDVFSVPGTGNIYMNEVVLGYCIHDVMVVISFDEDLGDIVINFKESELLRSSDNDYMLFFNKLQLIITQYDIDAIVIGYEPATDIDMQLIALTKQSIKIFTLNFPLALNDYKKNLYTLFTYKGYSL